MLFKIFISSPGDVRTERDVAERVITEVGSDDTILSRWKLQAVRWDKDSEGVMLEAQIPPQEAVNRQLTKPSECDLVIVILGSRMGTPLGPTYKKKVGGGAYLSGTEWEYLDAVERRNRNGKPTVWLYHREQTEILDTEDAVEQMNNLKLFVHNIRGTDGGVNSYKSIDDFKTKFAAGLRKKLLGKERPFNVPPIKEDAAFFGRSKQIEDLVKALIARKNQALVYLPGVGKTTLACQIGHRPEWYSQFAGVLWADVGKDSDLGTQLERWAEALEIPEDKRSTPGIDYLRAVIRDELARRSNLLIILDDVWSFQEGAEYLDLGTNCTYLMTTRSRRIAKLLQATVTDIDPLTRDQSLELLKSIAPDEIAAAQERFGDLLLGIIDSLDGLPIALEMTGKFLNGKWAPAAPQRLERALLEVQKAGALFRKQNPALGDLASRRLIPLYETYYQALPDDESRRAARELSAFRPNPHHFTPEMAETICAVSDEQLEQLEDAGFIKIAPDKASYSMHRTISEFAFSKFSSDEGMAMHAKALKYYDDKLDRIAKEIDNNTLSYASWYRYENGDWQKLQLVRLYHVAAAYPEGDLAIALAIVRIYFDAFWWWGYYQPFAFCDALIGDWERRTNTQKVRTILKTLLEFGRNYPEGYEKKDKPGWPAVKEALLSIRRDAGLEGAVTQLNPDQLHIRALMDFFLSEAYAYAQDRDLSLAMQTYESARSSFELLGDDWNHSWILFYMADLLQGVGETDDQRAGNRAVMRTYCEASTKLAENMVLQKRDPEILGNIYRVLGDVDFTAADFDQAAQNYFYASGYAFAFQGIPVPPDTYTAEFYREITEKVSARIANLIATDPLAGRQMREGLKARWAPYIKRAGTDVHACISDMDPVTAEEIAAYIFPDPPTEHDLKAGKLEYQANVLATVGETMFRV